MIEYPIPRHLKGIFTVKDFERNSLDGKIVCECGCENFKVLYFGNEYKNGHIDCLKYKDGFAMNVTAVCVSCGKEHLLFDLAEHGFDGFINSNGIKIPDNELKEFNCCKSGFNIEMQIETCDKENFAEDFTGAEKFSAEDYVDAFNWLVINLECPNCKKTFRDFVNIELS